MVFEAGLGVGAGFPDQAYLDEGGREAAREEILSGSELILGLAPPSVLDVLLLNPGAVYVGFLDPFGKRDLLEALARRGVSALSMEMIPRNHEGPENGCSELSGQPGGLRCCRACSQPSETGYFP